MRQHLRRIMSRPLHRELLIVAVLLTLFLLFCASRVHGLPF